MFLLRAGDRHGCGDVAARSHATSKTFGFRSARGVAQGRRCDLNPIDLQRPRSGDGPDINNTAAKGMEMGMEMKSLLKGCLAAALLAGALPNLAFAQTATVKLGQI